MNETLGCPSKPLSRRVGAGFYPRLVAASNFFSSPECGCGGVGRRLWFYPSAQEFCLMANYDRPNRSKYFNGPIYDQMAEDLQLNGKAQRTVHGYLRADYSLVLRLDKGLNRLANRVMSSRRNF